VGAVVEQSPQRKKEQFARRWDVKSRDFGKEGTVKHW
jgi:hypothetical protein